MFTFLKNLIDGNQRKILVVSVLVSGIYLVVRYARYKLLALQKRIIQNEERRAREALEKVHRLKNYQITERSCNNMIRKAALSLYAVIMQECNTDTLLRQLRDNPVNKVDLWEKIKIISFTRLATLIYATSLLAVTLRVQFSILGGYLHCDTLSEHKKISDAVRGEYICWAKHFLRHGLFKLMQVIRKKVVDLLRSIPLDRPFNLDDLKHLLLSLQMSMNCDESEPSSSCTLYRFVMPPGVPVDPKSQLDGSQRDLLNRMFEETRDVLERACATQVCLYNVCYGFLVATTAITENFPEFSGPNGSSEGNNGSCNCYTSARNKETLETKSKLDKDDNQNNAKNTKVTLARLIPVVCGLTVNAYASVPAKSLPSFAKSLIACCADGDKSKMFGACIFQEFSSPTRCAGETQ